MRLTVTTDEELAQAMRRAYDDPKGELFNEVFAAYFGDSTAEHVTEIEVAYNVSQARSALEDGRRFFLKVKGADRSGAINGLASIVTGNPLGLMTARLNRRNSIDILREEFRFVPDTFRWHLAALFAAGWREVQPNDRETLLLFKAEKDNKGWLIGAQ